MRKVSRVKLLALSLSFVAGIFSAQQLSSKSVNVSVEGTSPMHNWTMTSTTGSFSAQQNGNTLTNVKFTMPVKNLKSSKGKMMDNKAYGALKASTSPTISFTTSSLNVGKSVVNAQLSIAGKSKTISMPVTLTKTGNAYKIVGIQNLKMSDFGMETPGFMGVKTGDQVKVSVSIVTN
ncbi:YceI family protein [Chryseobacterium sp. A301]